MKESLKIRVNDSDRQEVIDLLGSLGKSFCWDVKTRWSEVAHIFVYQPAKNLERGNDDGYFDNHVNKEITLPELRELAKLREYLNDKFELVVTNQPESTWLVIPDGSLYLFEDGYGKWFNKHMPDNPTSKILWQRENKVETVKGRFFHQWAYEAFGRGEDVQFDAIIGVDWTTLTTVACLSAFDNPNIKFRLKP